MRHLKDKGKRGRVWVIVELKSLLVPLDCLAYYINIPSNLIIGLKFLLHFISVAEFCVCLFPRSKTHNNGISLLSYHCFGTWITSQDQVSESHVMSGESNIAFG